MKVHLVIIVINFGLLHDHSIYFERDKFLMVIFGLYQIIVCKMISIILTIWKKI